MADINIHSNNHEDSLAEQNHLIAQSGYIPETEAVGWIQSQGYEPFSPSET